MPAGRAKLGSAATSSSRSAWKIWAAAAGGLALLLIALLLYFQPRSLPSPTVSGYVAVTRNGSQKDLVGTDGARLYFNEYASTGLGIAQVSTSGGEVVRVQVPGASMSLLAVSPDGSALLVAPAFNNRVVVGANEVGPVWALPVLGGTLRKLGDGRAAAWSPDGQRIVYATGHELLVAKSDGSDSHQVVSAPDRTFDPVWSPDGKVIRFSIGDYSIRQSSLWEVSANGTNLHPLFPDWHTPPNECCGKWTPDQKYFVFFDFSPGQKSRLYTVSIDGGAPQEILPDDPQGQLDPNWSPDGTKIVFAGASSDRETAIRILDLKTHQISNLPDSKGLFSPRWSPDGQYLVAMPPGRHTPMLFDFAAQKWKELSDVTADFPNWSKTGEYLYFLHEADQLSVMRVRIRDRKLERVADLTNFRQDGYFGYWLGLAPDDSPLLLRDTGTQEIYALDSEAP